MESTRSKGTKKHQDTFGSQTYTSYHFRKYSYRGAYYHTQTEPLGNVRIISPNLSKNIPPCAIVSRISRTGQRKCTHLRWLHSCPALRGCLFAVPLNAKTGGSCPMKKVLTLVVLLCLHTPALAAEPGPPAQLVEAIARQESGLNPLAVNIAGKSYYPATREEAERLIRQGLQRDSRLTLARCRLIAGGWSDTPLIRFPCSTRP